jgi:tetratricopeptide (TPR) repeat protein
VASDSPRLPLLSVLYQRYLDNQDAAAFVSRTAQVYHQGTLERLATHASATVRRSAVLALGFLGDYEANPVLGRALLDKDRTVRILADSGIRTVWTRMGNDAQQQRLAAVIRLNTAQHYDEAIQQASKLVHQAPWFAEAWNQRAVARFAQAMFAESIRDGRQALEINPYHFLAAAGMGHAYLQMRNPVSALECFRRALRLNPDLEGVRVQVARLTKLIGER